MSVKIVYKCTYRISLFSPKSSEDDPMDKICCFSLFLNLCSVSVGFKLFFFF